MKYQENFGWQYNIKTQIYFFSYNKSLVPGHIDKQRCRLQIVCPHNHWAYVGEIHNPCKTNCQTTAQYSNCWVKKHDKQAMWNIEWSMKDTKYNLDRSNS